MCAFDNSKYIKLQTEKILERINMFDNKLYLEFGGKLFDDLHASRVLPGFHPNAKVEVLKKISKQCEIIFTISAVHIERNKMRADYGIPYDMEVLRQIDNLRAEGLYVSSVVVTLYNDQPSARQFANRLERRGEKVYLHRLIKGYPSNIDLIASDEGYGANAFIETTKPIVIVTAPGPGSGKMATCLSQIYHEYKRGVRAGYAKFETFPVWNLDLKHPVNVAYESATAEMKDINMVDSFHFNAYGEIAVNYNRDLEIFPVVKNLLEKITGSTIYKSPTDMGVNMVGYAITDDEGVCKASKDEIIRRYYRFACEYKKGLIPIDAVNRVEILMTELGIKKDDRVVVESALKKARDTGSPSIALALPNGKIITGRSKELIGASAAAVLNALKTITKIKDPIDLIPPAILEPVLELKTNILGVKYGVLSLKDVLLCLSMSASINPTAQKALENLKKLRGVEAHSTYILNPSDGDTFARLGINITSEPVFLSKNLFEV